jgi:ankyrin repeat protein
MADKLLAAGADSNVRNRTGQKALHVSFLYQRWQVAKRWLAAGADPAAVSNGSTCYHMAAAAKQTEVLASLPGPEGGQAAAGVTDVVQGLHPLQMVVENYAACGWLTRLGADVDQLYGEGALEGNGESLVGASCLLWVPAAVRPLHYDNGLP